jgi:uncharacterized protein (DUF4415 family)
VAKKEHIVSYSADELRAMRERGESQSDFARAAADTQKEIEASAAADPDEAGFVVDWSRASVKLPKPKAVLNMRIDRDILEFFRRKGRGYQTKINAVLRAYVDQARHSSRE